MAAAGLTDLGSMVQVVAQAVVDRGVTGEVDWVSIVFARHRHVLLVNTRNRNAAGRSN